MRALAAIALATTALFMLPGCGEAEKLKEKQALEQSIRTQVQAEVSTQVRQELTAILPGEIQNQLRLLEEQKKQQAELEKQQALQNKTPGQAGQTDPAAKPATTTTTTSTKKKKPKR